MSLTTATHLNFRGDARDALRLYQSVFGGALSITTYGELGMPAGAPEADKVVFARLATEDGFRLLAYDVPGRTEGSATAAGSTRRENGVTLTDQPFFVSVDASTLEEVQGVWDGLAAGATVVEPLAASAWSAGFGMLTDRFGVTWVLGVAGAAPAAG
ncbi:VOC family protein [Cellulomonas edaphi]|uniref:VOC family protein n=1 Tax=Cellulomonas edaphi TaxID=3053468 RepID=A0ABT7S620_9CELL|nr:VOC family protein [Cellulomons edaphi]MDM7831056.1 VOC family protein [Cellulomons edaphi]